MSKYGRFPLDDQDMDNIVTEIRENDRVQKEIISTLCHYLSCAIGACKPQDGHLWYKEADELVKELRTKETVWKNLRTDLPSPPQRPVLPPEIPNHEDDQMSEAELAVHFGEPPPAPKELGKPIENMTIDEIKALEAAQDNSNDIYKISARVKNLATMAAGNNLTNVGVMLANSYTHVLKSLYDFSATLKDEEVKRKLVELVRSKEGMPADFIAAIEANVKEKK